MRTAIRSAAVAILIIITVPALAAKYQLAYWRELGAYENQAPPAGQYGLHDVWIHVWNEDGTPRPNVQIHNISGYYFGSTNASGVMHTLLWSSASEFVCRDGSVPSEATPVFDERRWPHSGHYSWEAGFVYRSSTTPPEVIDTNYNGILNSVSGDNCHIDAPCTRSLAFVSTNPLEACSDPTTASAGVTEAGQTFVASGDRVVAAKAWVNGNPGYIAQILDGGPNGSPIGSTATATAEAGYQDVLAAWSFNSVPVTPGNTYYLKITRAGGAPFQVMRTLNNNYSTGSFYENKVERSSYDMVGAVVMAWSGYNGRGRVSGRVRDINGNPLAGAIVTASPGGANAQADKDGYYTIYHIPAGAYSLTASKWGYSRETLLNRTVTAGSTKTVDFDHLMVWTNLLTNPGFETDSLTGWSRQGTFNTYSSGEWAVPSRAGDYWGGNVAGGGNGFGSISQQVNVTGSYEYQLSVWYFTDAFNGNRTQEFPTDNLCRIGIDPTGSGSKTSPNVTWSSWTSSHDTWSELTLKRNAQPPYVQMTVWLEYALRFAHDWNKGGFDDAYFGRSAPAVIVDIDPSVTSIQPASATVQWHTNVASDSRVHYGLTASYGQSVTVADSVTGHSVALAGLQPNSTYHFKVTSASSGYTTGSSGDFTFVTPRNYQTVSRIADLDAMPDGTDVYLPSKRVTGGVDQFGSMFYIQETDFFAGVRANSTDTSIHEGDTRGVYGTLATVDGERCVNVTQTTLVSPANPVPRPVGIRLAHLGGVEAGRPLGVNTVGTLMRVWGAVGASGSDFFYLVDPGGYQVRVFCGSLTKPTGFAAVTGCCGETLSGGNAPVLRVRKQADIN